MQIEPIVCWRPQPEKAAEFASPPYDVFDRHSAREYVAAHPKSFLAIDRPETAFEEGHDIYAPEVYAKGRELVESRVMDGTLLREECPCLFAYRMSVDGHSQLGIVAACGVDDLANGVVHAHELTRHEKVADRVNHELALGAQTSPVLLTYPQNDALDTLVALACTAEPLYDITDEDGVRHTIWRIARPAAVGAICAVFGQIDEAYIADGHHRAAAAAAICKKRREEGTAGENDPSAAFLALLFPMSQMLIRPYNRVVADTCGLDAEGLVRAIQGAGIQVEECAEAAEPAAPSEVMMRACGSWYRLTFAEPGEVPAVERLDVYRLQELVLGPILGVDDPQGSDRVRYVGGKTDLAALEALAGEKGVAFALYPTSMGQIADVANEGGIMPPKSTWFEPKPLSGLFLRRI